MARMEQSGVRLVPAVAVAVLVWDLVVTAVFHTLARAGSMGEEEAVHLTRLIGQAYICQVKAPPASSS